MRRKRFPIMETEESKGKGPSHLSEGHPSRQLRSDHLSSRPGLHSCKNDEVCKTPSRKRFPRGTLLGRAAKRSARCLCLLWRIASDTGVSIPSTPGKKCGELESASRNTLTYDLRLRISHYPPTRSCTVVRPMTYCRACWEL